MKTAGKKTKIKPKQLDEETSARVIGEFLAIWKVGKRDIDALLEPGRKLTYREIALSFRVASALDVPDAFAVAPRFRLGFEMVRKVWRELKLQDEQMRKELA